MVNYATVADTKKLALALKQIDVLPQLATYFPVPGGVGTRKVQFDYLKAPANTKITEEYQMNATKAELFSAAREQLLITSEAEFQKRAFDGAIGGNEGNLPALTLQEMAYNHQPVRTEYVLMQDVKFVALDGLLYPSSQDTLERPSTCETTAGTAETPGATYTDNGDLTKMAPQTDLNIALKRLAIMKMRRDNVGRTGNPLVLCMHPIAAALLDSYNYAVAGSGSATWEYSDQSNLEYFTSHGVTNILELACIDSDYAGAEAGTTQFAFAMNYQLSFFIGVGKPIGIESWWENDSHTAYFARVAEALVPIALPLYKDSSNDYFKPVLWLTTTPWN